MIVITSGHGQLYPDDPYIRVRTEACVHGLVWYSVEKILTRAEEAYIPFSEAQLLRAIYRETDRWELENYPCSLPAGFSSWG